MRGLRVPSGREPSRDSRARIIPALQPVTDALADPAYFPHVIRRRAPSRCRTAFGSSSASPRRRHLLLDRLEPVARLVNAVGLVEPIGRHPHCPRAPQPARGARRDGYHGEGSDLFHLPLGFCVDTGGAEFSDLWAVVLLIIAGGAVDTFLPAVSAAGNPGIKPKQSCDFLHNCRPAPVCYKAHLRDRIKECVHGRTRRNGNRNCDRQ